MVAVGTNKWSATCGRCGRRSAGMLAASPEHAWATLQKIGWRLYRPRDAQPFAECRSCASAPHTVAQAVRHVKAKKQAR